MLSRMTRRLLYLFFGTVVIFASVNIWISVLFVPQRDRDAQRVYKTSLNWGSDRTNHNHTHVIFLLCKDRFTEAKAIVYGSALSLESYPIRFVTVPYAIPSTLIQHHYFYTNIVTDLINFTQFAAQNWIGFIPFHGGLDDPMVDHLLQSNHTVDSNIDLIALTDPLERPTSCCPDIMNLVEYILVNMGESSDNMTHVQSSLQQIRVVGRLGFMIRAQYVRSFSSWISRAIIFLTTDARAQQMVINTCRVPPSEGDHNNHLDLKFTPNVPLLGELLASYFFHSRKLKIFTVGAPFIKQDKTSQCNSMKQHSWSFSLPKAQSDALQSVTPQSKESQISMLNDHSHFKAVLESNRSSLIFILWNDRQDSASVVKRYSTYPWAQPIPIPSTYLLENYFYTNLLEQIVDYSTLTSSWIGSIRGDPDSHMDIKALNRMLSDKTLVEAGVEVLSFFDPLQSGMSIHKQAEDVHPGLMKLIEYLLISVGERNEDIQKLHITAPEFKGLFSYSFACRPLLMRDFIQWLSRITVVLMTDSIAKEMAWKNSEYHGDIGLRMQVFGSDFFPFHSVVGERLVSYYFNARRFKIVTLRSYKIMSGFTTSNASTSFSQIFKSSRRSDCIDERSAAPTGLGSLYNISLFYHVGMIRNWREIVEDQLSILEKCGLGYMASSLTISYSDPSKEIQTQSSIIRIQEILNKYPFSSKLKVSFLESSSNIYERNVMEEMASYCHEAISNNPEPTSFTSIVFYFHNKGSTKYVEPGDTNDYNEYVNTQYWRKFMEYFLLERPTLCTRAILNHGTMTCGVEMRKLPSMHYSGNFWAASCNHLQGLAKNESWPNYNDDTLNYISPEMWLGNFTNRAEGEEIKYLTLFNIRGDLYNYRASPDEYTFVLDEKTYLQSNHSSFFFDDWPVLSMYDPGNQTGVWLDYESGLLKNNSS